MVFVELGAFAVFAGLVSAWALWVYPKLKINNCNDDGSKCAMSFTTGECSYGLARGKNGEEKEGEQKEEGAEEDEGQMSQEEEEVNTDNVAGPDVLFWDGEKYAAKDEEEKCCDEQNS